MAGEGDDLNKKIIEVARSYMSPPRSSKPVSNRKSPAKDLSSAPAVSPKKSKAASSKVSAVAESSKRPKAASPKPSTAAEKKLSNTGGVATEQVRKSSRLQGVEAADMSVNRAERNARERRKRQKDLLNSQPVDSVDGDSQQLLSQDLTSEYYTPEGDGLHSKSQEEKDCETEEQEEVEEQEEADGEDRDGERLLDSEFQDTPNEFQDTPKDVAVEDGGDYVSDGEIRKLAAEEAKAARTWVMAKKSQQVDELAEDKEEEALSLRKRKRASSAQREGRSAKNPCLSKDIVAVNEDQPLQTVVPKKEKYVFNPDKGFTSTCSPEKIMKRLCRLLVVKFSTVNRYIEVGQDKMRITADNVHDVLGLPIGGVEVPEVSRYGKSVKADDTIRLKWKEEFGVDAHGDIPTKYLLNRLTTKGLDDKECLGADFKKFFVMYIVTSFLNPQARSLVDLKLVDALEDVDMIPKYDWCRYVLVKLVEGVKSYFNTKFAVVNGCLIVPLLVFLHQYPLLGEELPCSLPLIVNWDTKKLMYTCKEVLKEGIDAMLKSSQTFPLTCKGKPLDSGVSGVSAGVRPSSSSSMILPSASDVLSFRIPEGMLTDRQIWDVAKADIPRALCLQFHRNVEIMARVYLAEVQEYLHSGKMVGQDEEAVSLESKKILKDPKVMKGVQSAVKQCSSSSVMVPFRHSPKIGPLLSFSLGFEPTEEELLLEAVDNAVREDDMKKAAAAGREKKAAAEEAAAKARRAAASEAAAKARRAAASEAAAKARRAAVAEAAAKAKNGQK